MKVRELYTRHAVTIRTIDELIDAARLMRDHHIGSLIVTECAPEGSTAVRPVGILTDRDIVVEVVATECDIHALQVSNVMSQPLITVQENEELTEALARMRQLGVRRMPVVDAQGYLLGMLSLDDVLKGLASELRELAEAIQIQRRTESASRS